MFECKCLAGWSGPYCSIVNGCEVNPCYNGGECTAVEAGGFICDCAAGYIGSTCLTLEPLTDDGWSDILLNITSLVLSGTIPDDPDDSDTALAFLIYITDSTGADISQIRNLDIYQDEFGDTFASFQLADSEDASAANVAQDIEADPFLSNPVEYRDVTAKNEEPQDSSTNNTVLWVLVCAILGLVLTIGIFMFVRQQRNTKLTQTTYRVPQ
jgi:hypothetical protein